MLDEHYARGVQEALKHYGVKEANALGALKNFGTGLGRMMVGHPDKIFNEVRQVTRNGGGLLAGLRRPFQEGGTMRGALWSPVPRKGLHAPDAAHGMKLTNPVGAHAAGTKVTPDIAKQLAAAGHKEIHATPTFGQKLNPWMNRVFGTILPAYGVIQAARGQAGDPNESRLTNTLGAIGGGLGAAYGFHGFGVLGAPYLANAGSRIGTGVGKMFGSPSQAATQAAPPVEPQYAPYPQYPGY